MEYPKEIKTDDEKIAYIRGYKDGIVETREVVTRMILNLSKNKYKK